MSKSRLRKSRELFEVAKTATPGGVQKSRHPSMFIPESYPIFIERGEGSRIYDVDGNEYIDWLLSYGPIILGHCYPKISQAVIAEIEKGFLFNLSQPLQVKLAQKLIEIIPCAEKVIFLTTGSGATSAAIRIARIYTGREKVIRWGYHGWHDWCYGGEGVPKKITEDVLTFNYNDLDSLQKVLEKNKNQVACVIMMPFEIELPKPGFLEGIRELTYTHGVILIFDEIRSGFRMALGGAQEYFNVTPDMTTLCKAIANGYPFSVVVGKKEIMAGVEKTNIAATFFPSSLGMAAALATIQELEDTNAIDHMWKIGKQLSEGLRDLVTDMKVKAEVMGAVPMPYLLFGNKEDYGKVWRSNVEESRSTKEDKRLWEVFYGEMIKKGVFLHPNHHWFTCLSHTDEDVRKTLQVAEQSLSTAKESI